MGCFWFVLSRTPYCILLVCCCFFSAGKGGRGVNNDSFQFSFPICTSQHPCNLYSLSLRSLSLSPLSASAPSFIYQSSKQGNGWVDKIIMESPTANLAKNVEPRSGNSDTGESRRHYYFDSDFALFCTLHEWVAARTCSPESSHSMCYFTSLSTSRFAPKESLLNWFRDRLLHQDPQKNEIKWYRHVWKQ